jgi:LDH2 family malate/lactate/ureidoglycolate dehydrogenase
MGSDSGDEKRVPADLLERQIEAIFKAWGFTQGDRKLCARLMVETDLRGVDSHGAAMLERYAAWFEEGYIRPRPRRRWLRNSPTTAVLHGGHGLGHPAAAQAMALAIRKARRHSIGMVAVRGSNHFGAAACYSMMALPHGMIGLATTNAAVPAVVPTFGREPMFSTNPISVAVPAGRQPAFVLDMATSTVAVGKVKIAMRKEVPIPVGWAVDATGQPTTDPHLAHASRRLTPLGGTRELGSHKGYGLAVLVDILSGALAGAGYGDRFVRHNKTGGPAPQQMDVGHFLAALRVDRFRPLRDFQAAMDDMLAALKDCPPAEGQVRVLVAGEPEVETEAERRRLGIPLDPKVREDMRKLAAEYGAPVFF